MFPPLASLLCSPLHETAKLRLYAFLLLNCLSSQYIVPCSVIGTSHLGFAALSAILGTLGGGVPSSGPLAYKVGKINLNVDPRGSLFLSLLTPKLFPHPNALFISDNAILSLPKYGIRVR